MSGRRCLLAAVVAAALAGGMPAAASAMSVSAFLQKADALKAKGMMAMFSSDVGVLKSEVQGATGAWRTSLEAAKKSGRQPSACPPGAPQKMNADGLLAMLRAVPPAERPRTSVAEAVARGLDRRFPCPRA